MRTTQEILDTGAAWITEAELERMCKHIFDLEATRIEQEQRYRDDIKRIAELVRERQMYINYAERLLVRTKELERELITASEAFAVKDIARYNRIKELEVELRNFEFDSPLNVAQGESIIQAAARRIAELETALAYEKENNLQNVSIYSEQVKNLEAQIKTMQENAPELIDQLLAENQHLHDIITRYEENSKDI
jgi:hypothetical protein